MAITAKYAHEQPLGREEGFLHYLAREGRQILWWTIGICLVVIVAFMVSPLWFLAVIPALFLLGAYILLLLTQEVERRSDRQAHDVLERVETATEADVVEDHAEDDQLQPKDAQLVKRESRTGVGILIAVMLTAALIAAILFDFQVVAIGALVVFAYIMLVAAPLWLGWFNDDIEIESHRMENQPEPAAVKTGEGG